MTRVKVLFSNAFNDWSCVKKPNKITHSTNTVKINTSNVSHKKTVALFIWKRTADKPMRTHATHSCFLVYLCYIFLFFLTRKTNNKTIHSHVPWLKGSTQQLGRESWACALTCQWKTTTFTPLSCSLQFQKTMYYKNETQYQIFTSVQLNPWPVGSTNKSMQVNYSMDHHSYIQ